MDFKRWNKIMDNLDDGLIKEAVDYKPVKKRPYLQIGITAGAAAAAVAAISLSGMGKGSITETKQEQNISVNPDGNHDKEPDIEQELIKPDSQSETTSRDITTFEEAADENMHFVIETADELDDSIMSGLTGFGIELFKKTALEDIKNGNNALISPESVLFALGMTSNGACGNTKNQMLDILAKTDNIDLLNECLGLIKRNSSMDIANSVWVDDGIVPDKDFLYKVKNYYDAAVYETDLPTAVDGINDWVKKSTHGMIDKIIGELSDDARMVLINAIAFEGKWVDQYEDSQVDENGKFILPGGEEQQVNLLIGTEHTYITDDNTTGFIKYYRDCNYAFMAMLPEEGTDIADYVVDLSAEKFKNLIDTRKQGEGIIVSTKLPEFTYEYSASLVSPLQQMGIEDAFVDGGADFSDMLDKSIPQIGLYIGDVLHKTFIELDRNGTKAAAVTAVVMDMESCEVDINYEHYTVELDRPFVYSIVDMETGTPVFLGVLNSVE